MSEAITINEFINGNADIEISDDNIIFRSFFEQFNAMVAKRNYQYITEFIGIDRPKGSLVFMTSQMKIPYNIRVKICKKYEEVGWVAEPYQGYCADGPFDAILLYPKNKEELLVLKNLIFKES